METTTLALLDRWKKHHGLTSDYAAAKRLQVTAQAVSNWRKGRSHADVELAAKMAEDLDMEVIEVLAAIQADREPRAPAAAIWRRYGRPAFVALIAGVLVPLAQPGEALGNVKSAFSTTGKNDVSSHYAKSSGPQMALQDQALLKALSHRLCPDLRYRADGGWHFQSCDGSSAQPPSIW